MILGSVIGILIGRKYDFIFGYNMSALTNMLPVVLIKKLYKKKLHFGCRIFGQTACMLTV